MKRLTTILFLLVLAVPALASPGAHGPNGEHLDGQATSSAAGSVPRVETFSELFELVGHLSGGELSVLIDRYDTNEPLLNGKLEVQYQGIKAQAKFHSDIGDYAIDDEKMLTALAKPGKHALLFTFVHAGESDLLEGTLEIPAAGHTEHGPSVHWWWLLVAAVVLIAGTIAVTRARRRQPLQENK